MEITINAIDGGALRRSKLTLVAARTQAATPCASTYVGKSSVPAGPVCGSGLLRGWHEAHLSVTGAPSTGAEHRLGRLVVDPSSKQSTNDMSVADGIVTGAFDAQMNKFDVNFIARSGPPCRPSV